MGNIDFGPLVLFAIVGAVVMVGALGALIGATLALPFAAWQHDFSLLFWPAIAGAGVGGAWIGIILTGATRLVSWK